MAGSPRRHPFGDVRHNRAIPTAPLSPETTIYPGEVSAPSQPAARHTGRARVRRGPGWVPTQHGAWAMLASPLLVGILASRPAWVHLPLAALWFVGYFAFFATSLWLKAQRRAKLLPPVRVYGAASLALAAVVALVSPGLARWAPLFVAPLGIGLWAAARRRERATWSGLATVAGSALMTVVAYDAGGGTDPHRAWLLAAAQAAYFAGTVFYVKSLIRQRGNASFLRASIAAHVVLAAAMLAVSPWLGLVFGLLALRALLVPRRSPRPAQVGAGEIVATLVVAIVSLAVT